VRVIQGQIERNIKYILAYRVVCGPSSVVSIATGYGLDGPGIESRWGRDFPHLLRTALGPTQPPVQWGTGSFLGGKDGPGRDSDPLPLSGAAVKKE